MENEKTVAAIDDAGEKRRRTRRTEGQKPCVIAAFFFLDFVEFLGCQ
jgi:hypothetical protein